MATGWHEGEQGRRPVGWFQCQQGAGDGHWVSNEGRGKEDGRGKRKRVFELPMGSLLERGQVAGLERIKRLVSMSLCYPVWREEDCPETWSQEHN